VTLLDLLAEGLAELELGVLAVSASGDVHYCNRQGEELRATHDSEAGSKPDLAQVIASAGFPPGSGDRDANRRQTLALGSPTGAARG